MNAIISLSLPVARTPEAEDQLAIFKLRCDARLNTILQKPLNILVWGPGSKSPTPVYNKRVQIREELLKRKHNAMFSEELTKPNNIPTKLQELAQIQESDLAVVLIEDAPGALAEVHDFAGRYDTCPKLFILIPKKYQAGYSAKGAIQIVDRLFNGVYWYEENELVSCNVLTQVLERVKLVQEFVAGSRSSV